MAVYTIFIRWLDILAGLLLLWRDRRSARHWLKVAQQRDQLIVQQMRGQQQVSVSTIAAGAAVPIEVARAAQSSFIVLELSADQVVSRRMNVPARARDLLPGIVRNQIERLSAWRVNQAAYGFDVAPSGDATSLDVRILITSRALLEDACDGLGVLGLRVDRVVAGEGGADATAPAVTLWSRLADASDKSPERARRMAGGLVVGTACLAAAVCLWAFIAAASADSESEEVAARVAVVQRQVQGALSPQSIAALAPAQRAWALKETSPVAVVVVEAISRSLPDASYLTELHLERTTLRIVGLAEDAPALIAPLERSGHLKDVHFFAPTTRGADGARFLFHIEARVEPHLKIDGE
jgi:general secretion pathway protein L